MGDRVATNPGSPNVEIERKFLVRDTTFLTGVQGKSIRQGYIARAGTTLVRVRQKGEKGFLTIKAEKSGLERHEFEYEIPADEAQEMLRLLSLKPAIEKSRYEVEVAGLTWEVDLFEGANAGLVIAEVELDTADQPFTLPDWAGPEVTGDPRFFNAYLSEKPFRQWGVDYGALLEREKS